MFFNNRALKPIALKMKYPAVVVRRIFNPNFASRDNSNPKNNLVNYILEVRWQDNYKQDYISVVTLKI